MRKATIAHVMVLALLGCPGASMASFLAYDGFDSGEYTADSVVGQSGGTGTWSGAWTNSVNNDTHLMARAAGMEWTSASQQALVTTDGSLWNNAGTTFGSRNAAYKRDISLDALTSGDEIWLSFLMTHDRSENANVYIGFGLDSHDGTPSATQGFGLFSTENDTSTQTEGQLAVRFTNLNTYSDPAVSAYTTDPTLYVVRWVYGGSGNESLYLWADPSDLTNLGTPTLQSVEQRQMNVPDRVVLWREKGNYAVDEVRLGTTLEDVAVFVTIPEPATLTLVALGALALSMRRRRCG